jgi:hypothetical protein
MVPRVTQKHLQALHMQSMGQHKLPTKIWRKLFKASRKS